MHLTALAPLALLSCLTAQAAPEIATTESHLAPEARPRVLFLTQSSGFVHPVVKRLEKGKRAIAEHALTEAAGEHFVLECTQDATELTREKLEQYSCIVFYTTGALPIPDPTAITDFVRAGGGFVGVHSATDTFYEFADYGRMIGGYFDGHPWHQEVEMRVEQPMHPITAHLGTTLKITDEIYQFRDWSRDGIQVLLSLDPKSADVSKGKRQDGDYANAWCKEFGKGRVFNNALGHRPEVWANPAFLRMMVAGIRWAIGGEERYAERPDGAVALFDGSNTDAFTQLDGSPCKWQIVDGALEVAPGTGSIVTKAPIHDFVLHAEFAVPDQPDRDPGQNKGNSGLYLQRRYEVQILDSFGLPAAADGCGGLYRQRAPDVNASRHGGAWQDYWIAFRAARFDADGKKSENARITVVLNGVIVHDAVELTAKTGAGEAEGPEALPLLLQDHGAPVRFRNVWMLPITR